MGLLANKKSKRSASAKGLQALAEGSLALARAYAVLDKTEQNLEYEIQKDERKPPETKIGRLRFGGQKLMHTKQVLLCIVLLNILDCILVMGELILDIYYLKGVVDHDETYALQFITDMKTQYPQDLSHIDTAVSSLDTLHTLILTGHIDFSNNHHHSGTSTMTSATVSVTSITVNSTTTHSVGKRAAGNNPSTLSKNTYQHDHPIEVDLAHYFHYMSVTILAILVVENLFKLFCNGKEYFDHKLEVFDGFIVVASFIVDLVFIKGLSAYKVQKFVVILAFLVPWRVIRVVNSLIVAVIDQEHFRMKLLYKQKKQIAADLKTAKSDNKDLQGCLDSLRNLAVAAGVSEADINSATALHLQKKTKTSFATNLKQSVIKQITPQDPDSNGKNNDGFSMDV